MTDDCHGPKANASVRLLRPTVASLTEPLSNLASSGSSDRFDEPASRLDARMLIIKSASETELSNGKKSASLRYDLAAERARISGDEAECIRRLEAASKTLD